MKTILEFIFGKRCEHEESTYFYLPSFGTEADEIPQRKRCKKCGELRNHRV